jgi:glycolate oxidase iron-sulfur subunit
MSAQRAGQPLEEQLDGILTCVHCGFCLPACPTYEVLGDENDSPRGRIYLMRAVAESRLEPGDESFALHMDQCLGCRACEPVCPSGVRYGVLLEHAREVRRSAGGLLDRLARIAVRTIFSNRLLQFLFWSAAKLLRLSRMPALIARLGGGDGAPSRPRFAMAMLAATAPRRWRKRLERDSGNARGKRAPRGAGVGRGEGSAETTSTQRESEWLTVAHLEGCVMAGLFRHVNRATVRVVQAHGGEVKRLSAGLCCGALHAHAGEMAAARERARRVIVAFRNSGAELLLTNSAGCGAALKEYGEWLKDDGVYAEPAAELAARAQDVSEWLIQRAEPAYLPLNARVGYDAPCHLLHAQGIRDAPLELLRRVPGLEVEMLPRSDRCCGAAGTYGLLQRRLSEDILKLKLAEAEEIGVSVVTTGNPGCMMHIGAGALTRGKALGVAHPIELLDAALPPDVL